MALYGVDVSEFQGTINWDALNADSNFVMIRAAYGTVTDPTFNVNRAEAHRVQASAGPLGIGWYYFAYPTLLDPITSANYFADVTNPLQTGEVLALDLEGNIGPNPVSWALSFLKQLEARTGVKAMIYLNQSEVSSYNWQPVIDGGYGLWLAQYDGNKDGAPVKTPWPVVAMKQWTDVDHVAGISGNVDGDTFYGDFNAFFAYGYKTPAPAPAPQPSPVPPPPPPTPPQPVPVPTPPPSPTPPPAPSISFWKRLAAAIKYFFTGKK